MQQNQPFQGYKSTALGTLTRWLLGPETRPSLPRQFQIHNNYNSITTGNHSPDYKNFTKAIITEKAEQSPELVANTEDGSEG